MKSNVGKQGQKLKNPIEEWKREKGFAVVWEKEKGSWKWGKWVRMKLSHRRERVRENDDREQMGNGFGFWMGQNCSYIVELGNCLAFGEKGRKQVIERHMFFALLNTLSLNYVLLPFSLSFTHKHEWVLPLLSMFIISKAKPFKHYNIIIDNNVLNWHE